MMTREDDKKEQRRAINRLQRDREESGHYDGPNGSRGSKGSKLGRRSGSAFAPMFNPKADISKGIARRADPGDPHESPNNYNPPPGAPTDYEAGRPSRSDAKRARDKVAARRYAKQ